MVDRLFLRLHAMYGKAWLDLWADADIPSVKAVWAETLQTCTTEQMRLALDALAKRGGAFPPSLPEFRGLCEQFRVRGAPTLYLAAPRQQAPGDAFRSLRDILRKAGARE